MSERNYPTYGEIKDAQRQLAHNYSCSRDHCSPEERAVIEASVAYRESLCAWIRASAAAKAGTESDQQWKDRFHDKVSIEAIWDNAVDALIATRSKSEAGE